MPVRSLEKRNSIRTLLTTQELFLLLGPLLLDELLLLFVQTLKHQRTEWHARGYSHTSGSFAWENPLYPYLLLSLGKARRKNLPVAKLGLTVTIDRIKVTKIIHFHDPVVFQSGLRSSALASDIRRMNSRISGNEAKSNILPLNCRAGKYRGSLWFRNTKWREQICRRRRSY